MTRFMMTIVLCFFIGALASESLSKGEDTPASPSTQKAPEKANKKALKKPIKKTLKKNSQTSPNQQKPWSDNGIGLFASGKSSAFSYVRSRLLGGSLRLLLGHPASLDADFIKIYNFNLDPIFHNEDSIRENRGHLNLHFGWGLHMGRDLGIRIPVGLTYPFDKHNGWIQVEYLTTWYTDSEPKVFHGIAAGVSLFLTFNQNSES